MATFSLDGKDLSAPMQTMAYLQSDVESIITACWLNAIELGNLKQQVIEAWVKWTKLEAQIDSHPGHPKLGLAGQRADKYSYAFISLCVSLQQSERATDQTWKMLSQDDRETPAEVLGVPVRTIELLGGFHTYHPEVEVPTGFLWPESALHFSPPQQESALIKRVGVVNALRMTFDHTQKAWKE